MKVLIIALFPSRRAAVLSDSEYLVEHGAEVILLTLKAANWPELDPRVRMVEAAPTEGRHPVVLAERLVFGLPKVALMAVRWAVERSPGGPSPRRDGASLAIGRAQAAWERSSSAARRRWWLPVYRNLRPWVLWRATRRHLMPSIQPATCDLVVVSDAQSIPIGWHLSRRHPGLVVTFTLDREAVRFAGKP